MYHVFIALLAVVFGGIAVAAGLELAFGAITALVVFVVAYFARKALQNIN